MLKKMLSQSIVWPEANEADEKSPGENGQSNNPAISINGGNEAYSAGVI